MSTDNNPGAENAFLSGHLPALFAKTAAPIIFIMGLNGLLTVVDAWFLGAYVGADALTAVTLMFPLFMLTVAFTTLVSGGMASILARLLGAGNLEAARNTYVSAQALALIVSVALIALFTLFGGALVAQMANGESHIAAMGYSYIAIVIWFSPVAFLLGVNSDALRCEGKFGFMAGVSVLVSAGNIGLDYLLIVVLGKGVAGSAIATVLAQAIALAIVAAYRVGGDTHLRLSTLKLKGWRDGWSRFIALGAPQSLSFIGLSLSSTAVISALQIWSGDAYAATVAAYGIITRILTFAFLPLLGLSMAMQTIVGNNYGAKLWHRSDGGLKLALGTAFAYTALVEAGLIFARHHVGLAFVDDPATNAEVARILPITLAMYFSAGPMLVLSSYFQAIGEAARAAAISLTRTYLFLIPLTLLLPLSLGERGIWLASPAAELSVLVVAAALLVHAAARTGRRWGVFREGAVPATVTL